MTAYIRYRVTDDQDPWESNSIKGEPLTNQEIDKNWTSVISELDKKAEKGNPELSGTVIIDSTTAIGIPKGTTADREEITNPIQGMMRFNTDNSAFEYYNGRTWENIGKIAQGGGNDEIFYLNDKVITTDYTIPETKNAMTAGPVRINTGVTVTVPDGCTWSVVGDNGASLVKTYVGPTTIVGE